MTFDQASVCVQWEYREWKLAGWLIDSQEFSQVVRSKREASVIFIINKDNTLYHIYIELSTGSFNVPMHVSVIIMLNIIINAGACLRTLRVFIKF